MMPRKPTLDYCNSVSPPIIQRRSIQFCYNVWWMAQPAARVVMVWQLATTWNQH